MCNSKGRPIRVYFHANVPTHVNYNAVLKPVICKMVMFKTTCFVLPFTFNFNFVTNIELEMEFCRFAE